MPSTEPTYGWPIPDDSDPLADGAQAMRQLAAGVAATIGALNTGDNILDAIAVDEDAVLVTGWNYPSWADFDYPNQVILLPQGIYKVMVTMEANSLPTDSTAGGGVTFYDRSWGTGVVNYGPDEINAYATNPSNTSGGRTVHGVGISAVSQPCMIEIYGGFRVSKLYGWVWRMGDYMTPSMVGQPVPTTGSARVQRGSKPALNRWELPTDHRAYRPQPSA